MDDGESSTNNSSRPWEFYNTVFTNAKAGMEGVDKEKVQRIVYEMSKGSKYFQNEERKEALMKQKIEHMRDRCSKLSPSDLSNYQKVVDRRILELEATRDLSRIWLHVDMDAFYAAVETLSNPSLEGKPMAVGGLSMISTANYEARKFGVRAAMPGFIARKLCPDLIFVPVDFTKYTHYSDLTRKVFKNYDPHFIAGSLDEAYLDITEVCRERGLSGGEIAEELRSSVHSETGLTCSAGVAANRLLAKVCSDINKPNGQFVLQNDRSTVMTFISSLPIRKIGGIGKVTEHILKDALGIKTCEEMVLKGSLLYALFTQSSADFFLSVGLGLGKTATPEVRSRKSISSERTFAATEDERLLYSKLAEIAEMLSHDMKKEGLMARTLTLKLKTASFEIRSRAVSLQSCTCSSEDILKHATKLLKAELPVSIRLIERSRIDAVDKVTPNQECKNKEERPDFRTKKKLVLVLPEHLLQNEGFLERKRQTPSQRSRNQIKRKVANTSQYTHSSQGAIKTRDQVKQLQDELKRLSCFLENADEKQHKSERMQDFLEAFFLKAESKKGKAIKRVFRRLACIPSEAVSLHNVGSENLEEWMLRGTRSLENMTKAFKDKLASGAIAPHNQLAFGEMMEEGDMDLDDHEEMEDDHGEEKTIYSTKIAQLQFSSTA
ncbi:unnamed protein product [Thlaspi arvense]|uniref:DNA polymerase kappa n=1 Tax=Thlaspi arvense TaxID=13288 RepID=A0AAU9RCA8_THLAR|nr:unnamed protein product [Thlaspi arvense]